MSKFDLSKAGFGTAAIHAGQNPDPVYGALATPIFQTSTYCFETVEEGCGKFSKQIPGFVYSRSGNPTTAALEQKIAFLEGGEACVATASGMGAIGSVLVALLKAGDHVIAGNCVYGCTSFVMHDTLAKFGVSVSFVDTSDLKAVEAAIRPETKIIYFETPTNPTMVITDIGAISELAHKHAIRVVVDNTFAPPPIQYPIKCGADISLHSVTKYLNGHGDVIGGAVVGRADDIALIRGSAMTKLCGSSPSPFNSYLVLRGMQTLELRMARHCANGAALAKWLAANPYVDRVYYPGLDGAQSELIKKQMNGFTGAMISFELKDGVNGMDSFTACKKMINALKLVSIAVSLGDPETLIQHPASMTHGNMSKEDRLAAGISDGLIRLSAGLENTEDLISDFEQAFAAI
ncbi:PLP-dependent aspartate aminotransferase family protein [Cloacibacillus sp. An23]|uniref:trans-sulfuration enzyme family protein n=1 Tax=Cloacibacillus sp. An23 TaxID=1965591 RepID=UPI000B380468|nr:PLP-dependent aspartate aminotransferase family protein [Cloacibacillus sp. An23]OUO95120.1 methionine gamma-lyase [Cloacibacillus sp. An23]